MSDREPPEPAGSSGAEGKPDGVGDTDTHGFAKAPMRVLIVGGGFGGIEAAKTLARSPVEIVLIDRQNHHCFQPLLYQVATATLSPADIAWPIRSILSGQRNLTVLMADVNGVDIRRCLVRTSGGDFSYDQLVIATGATHAYFGHENWAPHAPGLKRIEDATEIRRRILLAFERAELAPDPAARQALCTFVVIGGGPTGVEMAGAIADMAREALPRDFRNIDPARSRVLLVEAGPRVLAAFPEDLSAYAQRALERRGVEVETGTPVTDIGPDYVVVGDRRIAVGAAIWAAGVAASAAADWLGAEKDRAGRAKVEPDLTVPGCPEIFVIGDTAAVSSPSGKPVPGIAPAAKQMGQYVGKAIAARAAGAPALGAFEYRHQGDLATIGRKAAVVKLSRLTLKGFLGWAFWGVAHVYFLIGLRNRIAVGFSWLWDYLTFGRRARLITESAGDAALERGTPVPSAGPESIPAAQAPGFGTFGTDRTWR
ncbi:NAD(P)/FAD-dependent oxidoreductase [Sphingomonas sp. H39-1-10]|uniref:NAD(P)/FAD-dependent oxidoreductase n=1 Tax=Sphingomonas pollutisoli TaxID=3030829 RepID=UPI0023B9C6DB|nr:NAD(P)/FAD-dependent oxidoreductase [Sphingomonas pollutisoli]MDF0487825.1 NAD(P)/FAD-dependent oxidoreductase [Sphingomonas pollutisoli]